VWSTLFSKSVPFVMSSTFVMMAWQVGAGQAWDSRITTNPAVTVLANGTLYMMYKASCCAEPASQTQVQSIKCLDS
jgi:hypothetical protein